jgi:hypothetical protein
MKREEKRRKGRRMFMWRKRGEERKKRVRI